MKLIHIGTITEAKGVDGSVFVSSLVPKLPALAVGTIVNVGFSEKFSRKMIIKSWSKRKRGVVISFLEITSPIDAQSLSEQGIFVHPDSLKSRKKFYFDDDVIGCNVVVASTGEQLGTITDIWLLPANDVWLVETETGELPLPFIEDVVKKVDIKNKIVEIELIPGLIDLINNKSFE